MDPRHLEALLAAKLGADTNIAAVYLFGSHARGTPRAESDVDLGVLYRVAPAATLLGQPFELQAALSSVAGGRRRDEQGAGRPSAPSFA